MRLKMSTRAGLIPAGAVLLLAALGTSLPAQSVSPSRGGLTGGFTSMISPAIEGAAEPRLTVDGRGRVFLSWLAPRGGGGSTFMFSALGATQFGTPRIIAEGPKLLANWADFPALFVSRDGTMLAHWLERGQSRAAYGIKLKASKDDGRTWTDTVVPHRDGTETEHGFVSFFDVPGAGPGSGPGLIWLDGRKMAGGHDAGAEMTLRAAMISPNGTVGDDMLVDGRVCDCCQTAAAATDDGVVVVYRDRSETEVRDMAVTRFDGKAWSPSMPLHADNWEINGCPVNGPAVAASGASVAAVWYTSVNDAPMTQMAFSSDGGRSFGAPIRIDTGTTLGRVGVSLLADGRALVSWIDQIGQNARFMVRAVSPDGTLGTPVLVSAISGSRTSGFPQVVVSGQRVIAAWTDVPRGAPTKVVVASATLVR